MVMFPSSVNHMPATTRWAFDQGVVDVFSDMLERSIPQYALMRESVSALAVTFAQPQTAILDLGCSRGDALAPLYERIGDTCTFHGVEISQPMLTAARERFADGITAGHVLLHEADLRTTFPNLAASIILSILTIQFTPIEYRQRIIQDIYDHLLPGGAFLFVEKILGGSARLDQLFVAQYYALKEENGYSTDAILRKRLSLEGVLVPVTAQWNEELLRMAGFRQVDCFWRWMNFAGWIAIK